MKRALKRERCVGEEKEFGRRNGVRKKNRCVGGGKECGKRNRMWEKDRSVERGAECRRRKGVSKKEIIVCQEERREREEEHGVKGGTE